MNRLILAVLTAVLASSHVAMSQSPHEASQMPYSGAPCTPTGGIPASPRQIALFATFDTALRSALQRQDVAALAFLIRFPLSVNTAKGTILIPDARSLAGHFAEIFSPAVRDSVHATAPEDFYCRYDEGLAYKDGRIWVSTDDHNFAIDTVNTPDVNAKQPTPSLLYTCETKTHRIVIEALEGDKFRYRSWNKPKELTEIPDVDLSNGKLAFAGTGVCSAGTYSFTKGNVLYKVQSSLGCTDGSEPTKATGQLNVTVAGKTASQAWCF